MVVAGNANYRSERDLPAVVPVFPLEGALLLPGGQMPLNVFEPRYIAMVDAAMRGDRLIGMIQPAMDGALVASGEPALCKVGCLGRITSLSETGDGRYILNLHGVSRFRVMAEADGDEPYRSCRIAPFLNDLDDEAGAVGIDRDELLRVFRLYLEANELDADWDSIGRASDGTLVNALCMMSPYGAAEKQALLEAADIRVRSEVLIALTEMVVSRMGEDGGGMTLQ